MTFTRPKGGSTLFSALISVAGLGLLTSACAGATGRRWIPAFNKASKEKITLHPRPGDPDPIYWKVLCASPDGKYLAEIRVGDGEYAFLHLLRRRGKSAGREVFYTRGDVAGYAWVPRHGHWLVFSTTFEDPSGARLLLWTGRKRLRVLKREKGPDPQWFDVLYVSADGKALIYELTTDRRTRTEVRRLKMPLPRY